MPAFFQADQSILEWSAGVWVGLSSGTTDRNGWTVENGRWWGGRSRSLTNRWVRCGRDDESLGRKLTRTSVSLVHLGPDARAAADACVPGRTNGII